MSVNSDELEELDIDGPVVMSKSQDLAFRYLYILKKDVEVKGFCVKGDL
jgi:hypothetical protein